ncbi:MAG: hypothetical protein Kow0075_00500 [Salibacteraceae bacterium]
MWEQTLCFLLLVLVSCTKLDPCLKQSAHELSVGDTLLVTSCATNAEKYAWLVDGEPVNRLVYPPDPFYNHYADSGGGPCDNFVQIVFFDTGLFAIAAQIGLLERGDDCGGNSLPKKSETSSVVVSVK